jgi:predicted nucleic acid-binding protein
VTTYLLDTTVLIAHLRGDAEVTSQILMLLQSGHVLATSAVNVTELTHGMRPREERATRALLERLAYLETTIGAARRAGRYQRELAAKGVTIHTPDALVAGTAREHGAVVLTDNLKDFPMPDVRTHAHVISAGDERPATTPR